MALNPSSFITRTPVEEYSIKYINEQKDYVAEEVFPSVVVSKTATKKYQYDLSSFREVETRSSSKAAANKVDYGVFTSNLTTELHKLAGDVDPRDETNADAPVADMEFDQAENILQRLLIKRERLMNTLVSTAASYPADLTATLGAGAVWTSAGGDPENDAKTAHAAIFARCGKLADSIMLSQTGYLSLRYAPSLRDRVKYTKATAVSDEDLKSLLNVQNIYVSRARYNNSIEGAADSMAEIVDDYCLFFVKGSGGKRSVGYGQTWMRNQLYSHTYEDQARGSGDGRIKVLELGLEYVMTAGGVISSSDGDFACGYYLDNIF